MKPISYAHDRYRPMAFACGMAVFPVHAARAQRFATPGTGQRILLAGEKYAPVTTSGGNTPNPLQTAPPPKEKRPANHLDCRASFGCGSWKPRRIVDFLSDLNFNDAGRENARIQCEFHSISFFCPPEHETGRHSLNFRFLLEKKHIPWLRLKKKPAWQYGFRWLEQNWRNGVRNM